jgi:hypothetical protein
MMLNFNRKPIHSENGLTLNKMHFFLTSSDQTHEKKALVDTSARAALEDTHMITGKIKSYRFRNF